MRRHHSLGLAIAAAAAMGMGTRIVDMGEPVLIIEGGLDGPDPVKMSEAEQRELRARSVVRVRPEPKPQASTHASINRNTGEPHQNKREIARRLRRERRAKGGVA